MCRVRVSATSRVEYLKCARLQNHYIEKGTLRESLSIIAIKIENHLTLTIDNDNDTGTTTKDLIQDLLPGRVSHGHSCL